MHRQWRITRPLRLHPLAACLVAALGLGSATPVPAHVANKVVVTSCQDSGTGSLRAAVQASADGDIVDLTQLPCSLITLTTGRIDISHNLELLGPGSGLLTVDGDNNDRIFNQNSTGELAIYGMTLQRGYGFLAGGCVYSNGAVVLNDAIVAHCRVIGDAGTSTYRGGGLQVNDDLLMVSSAVSDNEVYTSLGGAVGGGVSVTGDLAMLHSTISNNFAETASAAYLAIAGGADIGGMLTTQYSTISDNVAQGLTASASEMGGVRCIGTAAIQFSTISGNSAGGVGGIHVYGHSGTSPSVILNSTISDNTALGIGGLYVRGDITIANTTIAFNSESSGLGAGLRIAYGLADLESTIVASSSGESPEVDIGEGIGGAVTGSHNLIGPSGTVTLPGDTIQSDPMLLPLADNGGPTLTHELGSGSPAIDAGSNPEALGNDQRGTGFPRVLGAGADIGAVELSSDVIFANGFD